MNNFKLLPWQTKVAYGKQKSLAVPAPVRSGKDLAVVEAARHIPGTVIITPTISDARQMKRELSQRGVRVKGVFALDDVTRYDKNTDQFIFNEIRGLSLVELLQLRDIYWGRIVVIGTPRDIPDPIFYPLSKIPEWEFICGDNEILNPYIASGCLNRLSENTYRTSILAQWC